MIRNFPNEEWKELELGNRSNFHHAISNYGRIIRFKDKIENGTLLKECKVDGYPTFSYQILKNGKSVRKQVLVRRLVAENFIQKESEDQTYVLLLDRNRTNNFVGNLKWATKQEMLDHRKKSPMVIASRKKMIEQKKKLGRGHKLTSSTVKVIKKMIMDSNRKTRMKIIAKQFGISEMQLYRIKSGENWGHITID